MLAENPLVPTVRSQPQVLSPRVGVFLEIAIACLSESRDEEHQQNHASLDTAPEGEVPNSSKQQFG